LWLGDGAPLKNKRITFFFAFGEVSRSSHDYGSGSHDGGHAGPSSGHSHDQQHPYGLFSFLSKTKDTNPIYLLSMLSFVGSLALRDASPKMVLDHMRSLQTRYRDWVWAFINRVGNDPGLVNRAQ